MLGNTAHSVGIRRHLGTAANNKRVDRVERGERHVARRACCQPTFCLALHQAMLETRKKIENGQDDEIRRETGEPKVLAYADDAFLFGADRVVNLFLNFLEERLAHCGWKLVWGKPYAWIPSLDLLDETPRGQTRSETVRADAKVKVWDQSIGVCCGWRVQRVRRAEDIRAS